MERPVHNEPCQEPLDDEERMLMDPETWDWEHPVDAVVAEDLRVSFAISLAPEEHTDIARAARAAGLTTPAFMKHASLKAAREPTSSRLAGNSPDE